MIYPGTLDLEILQGASFVQRFAWKSGLAKDPVDLTGAVARMQVRLAKQLDDVLLEANATNGYLVVEDPLQGALLLSVPASVTDGLTFARGVYDIEVEMPDGIVHRILEGRISLDLQVTR